MTTSYITKYCGLHYITQHYGTHHTDKRGKPNTLNCRVLCKQHGSHSDNQDEGREHDCCLVTTEHLAVTVVLMNEPGHDKYTVVNTNTENKCRNDDIDEIEAYAENSHRTQDNKPRKHNREKSQERVFPV